MSEARIRVRAAIACDDVRHEIGGKMTLVGIYGPVIGLRAFPAQLMLRIVCLADIETAGRHTIFLRVTNDDDLSLVEWKVEMEAAGLGDAIPLLPLPLSLRVGRPVSLRLAQQLEGEWKVLQTWMIAAQADHASHEP